MIENDKDLEKLSSAFEVLHEITKSEIYLPLTHKLRIYKLLLIFLQI